MYKDFTYVKNGTSKGKKMREVAGKKYTHNKQLKDKQQADGLAEDKLRTS